MTVNGIDTETRLATGASAVTVDLTAVIVAVGAGTPRVLTVRPPTAGADALPWGPLGPEHRTLQAGLRAWVERQTRLRLGYVEQLYTFGDRDRVHAGGDPGGGDRNISVAYLALVDTAAPVGVSDAAWRDWYAHLPWEDARDGVPAARTAIVEHLRGWAERGDTPAERRHRRERVRLTFGGPDTPAPDTPAWDEERALERYELLYEAGLVPEAWQDAGRGVPAWVAELPGTAMAADHRRILATAIARLRAKIKYRPVLFELLPAEFTLLDLQRTAEALSGVRLHKQNFRRLVMRQNLVEPTGEVATDTGGRPARLMRFRPDVLLERPAPGVRVTATRRASPF
ncbi:Uncharacterized conserved protein [Limimonas halophila]|uniref:Uncharacterized conserved protein n=1 Tax=Limimonas halophila TaxID=1082479 RepID=A0A1G7PUP2_9PROT|nr:hypothetical protein [Limimonas halophila]SDF89996.1 Uncharacterized conserved protein [Limimonas halophila]